LVSCVLGNSVPVADITVPGCECFSRVLCWYNALSNGGTEGPHTDSAMLGQQFPPGFTEADGWGRPLGVSGTWLQEKCMLLITAKLCREFFST